jgi:hypothetical protein
VELSSQQFGLTWRCRLPHSQLHITFQAGLRLQLHAPDFAATMKMQFHP